MVGSAGVGHGSRSTCGDALLVGVAASPGLARGRLRFIDSLADMHAIQPGDVLVSATAERRWLPWRSKIGPLRSATGRALCASATNARICRVPAVFSLGEGVWSLREGQLVEVDGTRGTVRCLASASDRADLGALNSSVRHH